MSSTVRPFVRLRLTPAQRLAWRIWADEAPGPVKTVDDLLQWVRARKARIAASESDARTCASRLSCLDALFEWSTGVPMPDPPVRVPRQQRARVARGGLLCHDGGRGELEYEWLAQVVFGQDDAARAIAARLERRGQLRRVR
jgi:hypothetical protein